MKKYYHLTKGIPFLSKCCNKRITIELSKDKKRFIDACTKCGIGSKEWEGIAGREFYPNCLIDIEMISTEQGSVHLDESYKREREAGWYPFTRNTWKITYSKDEHKTGKGKLTRILKGSKGSVESVLKELLIDSQFCDKKDNFYKHSKKEL